MKKNKYRLLKIFILLTICIILIVVNSNKTSNTKIPRFSIQDTAQVSKLFIDSHNNSITISKLDHLWLINNKHVANKALIKLTLETLSQISVKEPVAKSDRKKINSLLNEQATKVEVYTGKKLIKTLFIGHPTPDSLGTYAKIGSSEKPYIIEIQGFYGYLTKRFPSNEEAWRTKTILHFPAHQIKSIHVLNGLAPTESFKIVKSNEQITFFDAKNQKYQGTNMDKLKTYINSFSSKKYQTKVSNQQKVIDSLKTEQSLFYFSLENTNQTKKDLKLYRKKTAKSNDFFGTGNNFDPNLFYLVVNDSEVYMASYFEFRNILKKGSYFIE